MSGGVAEAALTGPKKKVKVREDALGHTVTKISTGPKRTWWVCTRTDCIYFGVSGSPLRGLDDEIRRLIRRGVV